MPICEYCQKDEESHMCPEFVNKLRRERDAALIKSDQYRKALQEIGGASLCASSLGYLRRKIEEIVTPILPALLEKRKCPSTYTHSSLGKLECEKDEAHLHRIGDVEHKNGQQIWMSI